MVKGETGHEEMCAGMRCMLPLCHPFTAIVSGPTGCGKLHGYCDLLTTFERRQNPYRVEYGTTMESINLHLTIMCWFILR